MKAVDSTIKYTGKDFPEIGIRNGMSYDVLMNNLLSYFGQSTNKKISLLPVNDKSVGIEEAISFLLQNAGTVSTDNIKYTGKAYFDSGVTSMAIPVMNKNLKWETSLMGDYVIYSFDFSDLYDSLPEGYYAQDPRTRVSGLLVNGSTIIRESSSKLGALQIPFDRLPANAETEIRVLTAQGDIVLRANVSVSTASKGAGTAIFEVKDYSSNRKQETTLTLWGDVLSSKIAEVVSFIDQVKKYNVKGLANISDQTGLIQSVNNLHGLVDKTITDITNLNKVLIPGTTNYGTIQEALNYLNTKFGTLSTQFSDMSSIVGGLQTDVSGLTGEPVPSNPGCVNCGNDNTPDNGLVISYGSVTELTDAAFTSFISNDLSMVMFYTDNCSDCTQMEQVLLDLAIHYGISQSALIGKINISTYPSKGSDYAIVNSPSYIIFGGAALKEKVSGLLTYSQLKNKIDTYL